MLGEPLKSGMDAKGVDAAVAGQAAGAKRCQPAPAAPKAPKQRRKVQRPGCFKLQPLGRPGVIGAPRDEMS